jgi:hypothetical protein
MLNPYRYERKVYAENEEEKTRECSKCKSMLPISDFWRNKNKIGGRERVCKTCSTARQKAQRQTDEYREKDKLYLQKHRNENRDKYRARWLVDYHLRKGNIQKPERCEQCKKMDKLTAHHKDYNKPLDIVWLCYECHRNV